MFVISALIQKTKAGGSEFKASMGSLSQTKDCKNLYAYVKHSKILRKAVKFKSVYYPGKGMGD
jgi:hypothetical protein